MTTPCFEIVTGADSEQKARELLTGFPGIISWIVFSGIGNPELNHERYQHGALHDR